jgi:uncharacterized membrane protein YdcZ (DUF606 family)
MILLKVQNYCNPYLLLSELVVLGVLGILQWTSLRNYTNDAHIWVAASPISAIVGTLVAIIVHWVLIPHGSWSPFTFWPVLGFVYGGITGAALIFMESSIAGDVRNR